MPKIKFAHLGIMKASRLGMFPDGFLYLEVCVADKDGNQLKDASDIEQVRIIGPDGDEFISFSNSPYNASTMAYVYTGLTRWQGHLLWTGWNAMITEKSQPKDGQYTVEARSITGHKDMMTINYKKSADPISGNVNKVQFDQKNKIISWNPVTGNTGYRVIVLQDSMDVTLNTAQVVYFSSFDDKDLITGNNHKLPDSVKLEKGKTYHIFVNAFWGKGNGFEKQRFVHVADEKSEVHHFVAE